jgi:hypothetical protein
MKNGKSELLLPGCNLSRTELLITNISHSQKSDNLPNIKGSLELGIHSSNADVKVLHAFMEK